MRAPFIDHVTVKVRDLAASRAFYEAALAPFGIRTIEYDQPPDVPAIGFGPEGSEDFELSEGEPSAPVHVAFLALDPATVDAFHAAAMEAGGTDNGAPGPRERYSPGYYAAFVLDLDGNNVEAVCHTAPGG